MYEELVKMLRTCSERDSCVSDLSCPYLGTGLCDDKAGKAADAIVKLGCFCAMWEEAARMEREERKKTEVDNINLTGWLAEEHAKHLWISVTERLPKYGEKCLVHFKLTGHNDFHIRVSYCYVQREGFWSDCGRDYKATHWMPLPEPPKADKDGENGT